MDIEHKVQPVSGFKVLDDEEGIVEAFVSVTGIVDNVKDIIAPGAYERTLAMRTPKGVWSHDWNTPVSKTLSAEELLPGDTRLPQKSRFGDGWPREAGAVLVRTQFNLKTQRGREAYEDVKFYGDQQEWSIGYNVPRGKATIDTKSGIRTIQELDLFEYSPVLFGAMPSAVTQSVKSAQTALRMTKAAVLAEEKGMSVERLVSDIFADQAGKDRDEHWEQSRGTLSTLFVGWDEKDVYTAAGGTTTRPALGSTEEGDPVTSPQRSDEEKPYSINKRKGRYCVTDPDGNVVPNGCYDTREEALKRQRAMMANVDDADEKATEKPEEPAGPDITTPADPQPQVDPEGDHTGGDAVEVEERPDVSGVPVSPNEEQELAEEADTTTADTEATDEAEEKSDDVADAATDATDAPEVKAAVKPHSTDTTDDEWDGDTARKNLPNDMERENLREAFAWVDAENDNEDAKSAWRFIHHHVTENGKIGAANVKACTTAIGVLNGGRGTDEEDADWSDDRRGIWKHLAQHLKDAGYDDEDIPELKDAKPDDVEEKVHVELEGTVEQRLERLRQAVRAEFDKPSKKPDRDAANSDGPVAASDRYVFVEGTFDDRVIVGVHDYTSNGPSEQRYEVAYVTNADGTITLGNPRTVEVRAVVTPLEKAARALVEEMKVGRVMSQANETRVADALTELVSALRAAGVDVDVSTPRAPKPPEDETPAATEEKAHISAVELMEMQRLMLL